MQKIIDDLQYKRIRDIYPSHNNIRPFGLGKTISSVLARRLFSEFPRNHHDYEHIYRMTITRGDISYFEFGKLEEIRSWYEAENIAKTCSINNIDIQHILNKLQSIDLKHAFARIILARNDMTFSDKLVLYEDNKQYFNNIHNLGFGIYAALNIKPSELLNCRKTDWEWYYPNVCHSPHIDIDFVRKHIPLDANGVGCALVQNKNIVRSIRDVEENLDIPWDYKCLVYNPDITFEDIIRHIEKVKPLRISLFNKYVEQYGCNGEEEFKRFLEKIEPYQDYIINNMAAYYLTLFGYYVDLDELIYLRLRAFDIVNLLDILPTLSTYGWECFLSENIMIDYRKYKEYVEPIIPKEITEHKNPLNRRLFEISEYEVNEYIIRHFAAKRIQRSWKRCVCNPDYKVCRGRLLGEFKELMQ